MYAVFGEQGSCLLRYGLIHILLVAGAGLKPALTKNIAIYLAFFFIAIIAATFIACIMLLEFAHPFPAISKPVP